MNTSLLALLDVESLLFTLRRGGKGGGFKGGISLSVSSETNSAVGTEPLCEHDVVEHVPERLYMGEIKFPIILVKSNSATFISNRTPKMVSVFSQLTGLQSFTRK